MEKSERVPLSDDDLALLQTFRQRRAAFDAYLTQKRIALHACPGCGFPTLRERGYYQICVVCDWEDDGQDDADADEVRGGPNALLSLTQNRLNIGRRLAFSPRTMNRDEVVAAIREAEKRIRAIYDTIPMSATMRHPGWHKAQAVRTALVESLPNLPNHDGEEE